jgi:ADP-ribosyl-[dinitrogen reductase] hydrolase
MVAAMLLVTMGEDPRRAIQRVRAIRPGAIETPEQEAYVLRQETRNV